MNYPVVDSVTVTIPATRPEYVFEIALSSLGLDAMRHDELRVLGIRIPKNRYRFLNDLAKALAEEIVQHLERLPGAKEYNP